jgi:hypothetical protein
MPCPYLVQDLMAMSLNAVTLAGESELLLPPPPSGPLPQWPWRGITSTLMCRGRGEVGFFWGRPAHPPLCSL